MGVTIGVTIAMIVIGIDTDMIVTIIGVVSRVFHEQTLVTRSGAGTTLTKRLRAE